MGYRGRRAHSGINNLVGEGGTGKRMGLEGDEMGERGIAKEAQKYRKVVVGSESMSRCASPLFNGPYGMPRLRAAASPSCP